MFMTQLWYVSLTRCINILIFLFHNIVLSKKRIKSLLSYFIVNTKFCNGSIENNHVLVFICLFLLLFFFNLVFFPFLVFVLFDLLTSFKLHSHLQCNNQNSVDILMISPSLKVGVLQCNVELSIKTGVSRG